VARPPSRRYISATWNSAAVFHILTGHHTTGQYIMVSALTLVALVATTLASAVEDSEFTLKVLLKRQASTSGAQYQCHSDCGKSYSYIETHRRYTLNHSLTMRLGYTILDASAENCNNSTWTDLLANCQECANTYNIIRYYGDQVGAAAEDCGLTATFSPSARASSTSAPAETTASASSALSSSDTITSTTETTEQTEASTSISSAPSSVGVVTATSTSQAAVASGSILAFPSSNSSSNATQSAAPTGQEEFTGAGMRIASHAGATVLAALLALQYLL
jgi:hypothetical protein